MAEPERSGTGVGEPIEDQQAFWNSWNRMFLENSRGPTSQRQAAVVGAWVQALGRRDLDILDVGCGSGWMSGRLAEFGRVTATDLSDQVLEQARQRWPNVCFVAGDFMALDLPVASQDVVVTLEVISHVADPAAFVARIASLLRSGGELMLATQNPFVLRRWNGVAPRAHGQIRKWLSASELRRLLQRDFVVEEMYTVVPFADGGILRLVNSPKLNRLGAALVGAQRLERWKERAGLGHTIMTRARRR